MLIVGSLAALMAALLYGARRLYVWHSAGLLPPPHERWRQACLRGYFPARADGVWYESTATLWIAVGPDYIRQERGIITADGAGLHWVGRTVWSLDWAQVVAVHAQAPNGVRLHGTVGRPAILQVPDADGIACAWEFWRTHRLWWNDSAWTICCLTNSTMDGANALGIRRPSSPAD